MPEILPSLKIGSTWWSTAPRHASSRWAARRCLAVRPKEEVRGGQGYKEGHPRSTNRTMRRNGMRPARIPRRPSRAARLKRFEPRMTPIPTSRAPENRADDADEISGASAPSAVRPSNPAARPSLTPRSLRPQTRTWLAPRVAVSAKREAQPWTPTTPVRSSSPSCRAEPRRAISARRQRAATVLQGMQ
jgi:hypothetical protein